MSRTRTLLAPLAAVFLAGAIVMAGGSAATAYPADPADLTIVVLSKAGVTDPAQEDAAMLTALAPLGATVTTFDGGDASALAWTTALADADLLVLPEPEWSSHYELGGSLTMSDEAAQAVAAWVAGGGYVIAVGSVVADRHSPLFSAFTGLDYTGAMAIAEPGAPIILQAAVPGAPVELPYAVGTYLLSDYGTWSAELLAPVTPIYLSGDGQQLGVGSWAIGNGVLLYVAHDWFLAPGAEAEHDIWSSFLRFAAAGAFAPAEVVTPPEPAPAAEPELAQTGSESIVLTSIASGSLLLGIALMLTRRRRVLGAR